MNALFWFTYGVQWLITIALFVMVVIIYRQFGLMLLPGSVRSDLAGLDIGSRAPALLLEVAGESGARWFEWSQTDDFDQSSWLLLFAQPSCSICKSLWEERPLQELTSSWPNVHFLWVESKWREGSRPGGWTVTRAEDGHASDAMDIPAYPYAYLLDPAGNIISKGLVNDIGDIGHVLEEGGERSSVVMKGTSPLEFTDTQLRANGGRR